MAVPPGSRRHRASGAIPAEYAPRMARPLLSSLIKITTLRPARGRADRIVTSTGVQVNSQPNQTPRDPRGMAQVTALLLLLTFSALASVSLVAVNVVTRISQTSLH